ncbi:vesicle-trafficking protein SEC22a isoform X2 [Epinephelus fuscoguttatus]|uniref:vesicle-trafficking protein SEC22a isoform X2 n=1 Tax=Epinephelus fuscoguttatus TaxID=293821 RepID=UPI0020D19018|nr:vesicle-trafficking protein SEC22a isoform X2 [Epinephelus fuscoguttatus]
MSMVLFASVVRVGDGLPLSASTDYEQDRELQETKRHLKGLSKKLGQFPDRCTLKTGPYNVNFTSALGVGYLMVCTANYPNVLAFCFLDELQKEFIITYDPKRISSAVRPYSFIEFDTFIQKTKQRYNSPRSLSTKINLADMQTEIKLRPPYQLSPEDLRAINGFSVHTPSKYKGIAPTQMLEPVTLSGIVSCVLSILCGGLNLLRGVHAIESILQNDDEDFNYVIAFFLGTAACLYQTLHHRDDIMKVLGCRNKNQCQIREQTAHRPNGTPIKRPMTPHIQKRPLWTRSVTATPPSVCVLLQ